MKSKPIRHAYHTARLASGRPTVVRSGIDPACRFFAYDRTDISRALTGIREGPVIEWLLEGIDDETVFWDVGAFHGHYAVLAANRGAEVIAFEPVASNRRRLRANCELNDLTDCGQLLDVALSDTDGSASIDYVGEERSAEWGITDGGRNVVLTHRGDTVDAPDPDVVKIDVEGHETEVLDGMRDRLETVDRVAVEVHAGVDADRVRGRLSIAGLTVREIPTDRSQTYLGGSRE